MSGRWRSRDCSAETWSALVLDALPLPVLSVDVSGRVSAANAAAGTVLGREVRHLVGCDLQALVDLLDVDG